VKHLSKKTTETSFPEFPNDIIQGVAKEFVDLYSPIRETPEGFLWLAFVTYLGNAISPYVRLDSASSEPRFYGVVIGKSGRTRKSAGNNAARDVFKMVAAKDQQIIEGFGSAEGMLVKLGASPEPKRTIFHLDEINILSSKTSIKGSAGIAPLHKLFEDHEYGAPLANGGYVVENAYLSLLAASTVEDFRETWSSTHANAGFFSRLFLVAGDTDKRIARPVDPDPAKLAEVVQAIKNLVSSVMGAAPKALKMDPEAEIIWQKFYETFGDGPEWNRIDTYGLRLMVLQAVLRGEEAVTKENVQQVVEVLQYEVAVREAVNPIIAENPVAQMEETIRRYFPEGETLKKRDLQRATNYTRKGIEVFNRALGNMIANEEITAEKSGKSCRYTRARSVEADGASSEAVIGDVFESSEDSGNAQKANEIGALQQVESDCLQYSARAQPDRIM
jgi:hypothetical protein